ncbi:MAG: FliH/SctL family protein [Defluviitaleaceae bacterium]|nr:FliH/SctL family protein [Defluviitaleaceae bacterium]
MSSILKARNVNLETDNVISIEALPPIFEPEAEYFPELEIEQGEPPEETAERIIQKAIREAEQLESKTKYDCEELVREAIAKAEHEASELRRKAREEGFNEGYGEGYSKAESEGRLIIGEAETILEEAKAERKEIEESLEPDIIGLVSDIVRKLIGDATELYPQTIVNLARQGLSGATLSGEVAIHVSPEDYKTAAENAEALSAYADSSVTIEIVRDPSLRPMDCVIETPFGNIDCSLNMQYESLRDQLKYISGMI